MFANKLNPSLWTNKGLLYEPIRKRLIMITDNFTKSLKVELEVKDIVFTGSNANFDWNEHSDVDVHILVDFKGDEVLKKMMDRERLIWNLQHNIKIKGYKFEIYVEDINDFRLSSGIYSLIKDKWLKKPSKFTQLTSENIKYIDKKTESYEQKIKYLEWLLKNNKKTPLLIYQTANELFNYLKEKRKKSLEIEGKGGLMNIIYKNLRNKKMLDKLWDLINKSYDKIFTI